MDNKSAFNVDQYDENSTFTYNGKKITMQEYEAYMDTYKYIDPDTMEKAEYDYVISNNECDIPSEVLTQRGYSILGVFAYKTEQWLIPQCKGGDNITA